MLSGECNCGSVAFEINADVKDVYVCHCSICRKWTGNNGVAVVVVANSTLRWRRGKDQIRTWTKPRADWQSSFCSICGSALPVSNDDERVAVPAGLLDDADSNLSVAAHIWVGSKASWDEIGTDGHKYECAFGQE
ncbi:MAG: GFA family protein [Pseudomonadota bacterium]